MKAWPDSAPRVLHTAPTFSELLPGRGLAQCHQFWIYEHATLGPGCFPVLVYVPALAAILIFATAVLFRPALHKLYPAWLREFAVEEQAETKAAVNAPASPNSRPWTGPATRLLVLALTSAAFSALVSIASSSPLFLLPLLPALVSAAIVSIDRPRVLSPEILTIACVTFAVQTVALLTIAGGPLLPALFSLDSSIWCLQLLLTLAAIWTTIHLPMRDPFLDSSSISAVYAKPGHDKRSPEDGFSLWNWMTVGWLAPLIAIGAQRQLNEDDVWALPLSWQHARMFQRLREMRGSLLWRVVVVNARDIILISVLGIIQVLLSMAEVVITKQALTALKADIRDIRAALAYVALVFFVHLAEGQLNVFIMWLERRTYARSRGQLIVAIYEKGLRRKAFTFGGDRLTEQAAANSHDSSGLVTPVSAPDSLPVVTDVVVAPDEATPLLLPSNGDTPLSVAAAAASSTHVKSRWFSPRWVLFWRRWTQQDTPPSADTPFIPASAGKLYDLIRYDAYEVANRFWYIGDLCSVPMRIAMSLYLIVSFLGPSALLGVALVIVSQIASSIVARIMAPVERRRRNVSDDKLQITTNFINAIRHLRWYDWQEKWLSRIHDARQREIVLFAVTGSIRCVIYLFFYSAYFFMPVVTFYAYTVLAGHRLEIAVAFPALDLLNTLGDAMRNVPDLITTWINASIAWGRISSFMKESDKDGIDTDPVVPTLAVHPAGELRLQIHDGSFSWPGTLRTTLKDVNVSFPVGLTVVCGQVGAGKSALLQAILGEMDTRSGGVVVPHENKGFCDQTPWLESLSIRDNILFSGRMEDDRYRQVLDACCLLPDLASFTGGDLCHIGENGVGLSGGQRARVALARAVYSNTRILLLDDPIAALDHNTAETILRRLFTGSLLKGRIVVLVTHRTDLALPYADQVLEIRHGRVTVVTPDNMDALRRVGRDRDAYKCKVDTADDAKDAAPEKFIAEEHRPHGAVVASIYWRYAKYGSFWLWAFALGNMVVIRASKISFFYFVRLWGESYEQHDDGGDASYLTVQTIESSSSSYYSSSRSSWLDRIPAYLHLPSAATDPLPWVNAFAVLAASCLIYGLIDDFALLGLIYVSGKRISRKAMDSVAGATFRFYDVTPVGRLINRLTSDLRALDGPVVKELQLLLWNVVGWLSSLTVISATAPLFIVIATVTSAGFALLYFRFLPTAQALRRLETVRLSPLMSDFGILVNGLITVRAFHAEPYFRTRTTASIDRYQALDHFYWACQNWLQYRLDIVSALSMFLLSVCAIRSDLSGGTVAFVLTSAGNFVTYTHRLCSGYGRIQLQFVSVERILELVDIDQEPKGTVEPPASWPAGTDDIVFDNITVRYAAHLEPSLRNVSVRIPAGSTVAVTGRTGSGKSTLALALLGTILPDPDNGGDIYIGSVAVSTVNKHVLRSRVSFVAQDPVLFAGTLRDNLDPQNEHTDDECALVLERVFSHASEPEHVLVTSSATAAASASASAPAFTLTMHIDAGGLNMSQGQRQLIGLGRAILRRSAVVILDEATASIDVATAARIQAVLKTELVASTVLTIAHRAEAVAGVEYVLEMDRGTVKEFRKVETEDALAS